MLSVCFLSEINFYQGDRTNNNQEGTNSKLVKESECYPEPHKAVKSIVKNLKKAEMTKLRKADLQMGKKKKTQYTRLALQRTRLKKEFIKRGSLEERVKHMPKFLAAIATNILMTTQGSKTARTTYPEEVAENADATFEGNLSREPSLLKQTDDPYAHMVIGGKRKSKPNEEETGNGSNKKCRECPSGFNKKSKKVQCLVCDSYVHRACLTVDDDPDNYKCSICEPRRRVRQEAAPIKKRQPVLNFGCELCEFVSCHRYSLKRHLRRTHRKTEQEAEELAVEEDRKRVAVEELPEDDAVQGQQAEHADAEVLQQEHVEVEQQVEVAVEENQESVTDLLLRVNLQKLANLFEEEEITMKTLRTSTATELKGILKISFGSAKLIIEEVARCTVARVDASTLGQSSAKRIVEKRNTVARVDGDVGQSSSSYLPSDYPSTKFLETFSCGKCEDKFITGESLAEHIKEEHTQKEARCIFCGFLAKGRFQLNEHAADVHPLPKRVQNFGNYVIEEGQVVFSDEEEDEYDVSKENEDSEDSEEEEYEESGEEDEETEQLEEGEEDMGRGAEETILQEEDENMSVEDEETGQQDETEEEVEENLGKKYPCKECTSVFSFPFPLQLHIKNNHVGKLKCDECNFRGNTIKVMEDHEKKFHGTVDGEESLTEAMEQVQNLFDFGRREKRKPTQLLTPKVKKAKRTVKVSNGTQRFACPDCEGTYARVDALKRHRGKHH